MPFLALVQGSMLCVFCYYVTRLYKIEHVIVMFERRPGVPVEGGEKRVEERGEIVGKEGMVCVVKVKQSLELIVFKEDVGEVEITVTDALRERAGKLEVEQLSLKPGKLSICVSGVYSFCRLLSQLSTEIDVIVPPTYRPCLSLIGAGQG